VSVLPEQILHFTGVRLAREGNEVLPPDASLFEQVADFEARRITDALEAVNYSQPDAAARLKIPLSTLNQKIKRLGIPVKRKSSGN
jgi:transcriptional regulator with GAF, ATPase, and Fis domain